VAKGHRQTGRDVLFDVDWQGAQQISNSTGSAAMCYRSYSCPPSNQGTAPQVWNTVGRTPDTIALRMEKSWDEISHWDGL